MPKPSNIDAHNNSSLSSDEELFQECENGFDLETTLASKSAIVPAHSSNIDHNVFDKTIDFSSIAANSTAGVASPPDSYQQSDKSVLFQSVQNESLLISHINLSDRSDVAAGILEVPSIDCFVQPQIEIVVTENAEGEPDNENAVDVNEASAVNEPKIIEGVDQDVPNVDSVAKPEENDAEFDENPTENPRKSHIEEDLIDQTNEPTANVNATVNLNETTDLASAEEIIEESNEHPIEAISLDQNSVDNPNSTIVLEATDDVIRIATEEKPDAIEEKTVQIQSNDSEKIVGVMNSAEPIQNVDIPVMDAAKVNETFEAMDVDMNETIELKETITTFAAIEENILNQTVEMTDLHQADEVSKPALNVTVVVPTEFAEPLPIGNESDLPIDTSKLDEAKSPNHQMLNVTQDFSEESKTITDKNKTIVLPNSKENVDTSIQVNSSNDTFLNSHSPTIFNQTHNLSKDFLSSTRQSFDSVSKNPVLQCRPNLNETIVVDNKMPPINTSFIVSPKADEIQPKSMDLMQMAGQENQNPFKIPSMPTNAINPFDSKNKTQIVAVSDDEFQAPGCKFNFFVHFLFHFSLVLLVRFRIVWLSFLNGFLACKIA